MNFNFCIPLEKAQYWDTNEVVQWLENILHLGKYRNNFQKHGIDGAILLELPDDELLEFLKNELEIVRYADRRTIKMGIVKLKEESRNIIETNIHTTKG